MRGKDKIPGCFQMAWHKKGIRINESICFNFHTLKALNSFEARTQYMNCKKIRIANTASRRACEKVLKGAYKNTKKDLTNKLTKK